MKKAPPPGMHSVEDELLALVDRVDAQGHKAPAKGAPQRPAHAQKPPARTHQPSSRPKK